MVSVESSNWFCASIGCDDLHGRPNALRDASIRLRSFRNSATWMDGLSIGNHISLRPAIDLNHCRFTSPARPIFKCDKQGTENKQVGKLEHSPAQRRTPGQTRHPQSTCVQFVFVFIRPTLPCAAGIAKKLAEGSEQPLASSKSKQ